MTKLSQIKKAITNSSSSSTMMLANASKRRIMHEDTKCNDLQEIITQAINEIKQEQGKSFNPDKINLADLERRTGLSRSKLRRLKKNNFIVTPHARNGIKNSSTVLSGYTGVLDGLLGKGITNSAVCLDRIRELGYAGGATTVKTYIAGHRNLVPAKRTLVAPQGNRGRRYQTGPGESYQMDWGFVNVDTGLHDSYKAACFAMICHHCGKRYVEFFPNAKQENLFIGMLHAFVYLGIPQYILTDNMKSVVIRRDPEGHPIWQKDYESFMKTVGFHTKLCKPRHPFTKGAVERLVRFVKDNFLPGRVFGTITDLNIEALRWCERQNSVYHRAVDCIPNDKHDVCCMKAATILTETKELAFYLCPERRISFDGFVHYEGRRFGVPYWYTERTCRIRRDSFTIFIYSSDLSRLLTSHDVTWDRHDRFCKDQYLTDQPEEFPTMPVKTRIFQLEPPKPDSGFDKFNFGEGIWDE